MSNRPSRLPRTLFGYQTAEVDRMLSERDAMLGAADGRVRGAEARAAQLEEQLGQRDEEVETRLASLQHQLEQRDAEMESRRAEMEERLAERESSLRQRVDELEAELRQREETISARESELEEARSSQGGEGAGDQEQFGALEEQLRLRDTEIEGLRSELDSLRGSFEAMQQERAAEGGDEGMTSEFMTEELSHVVAAAEESATRIIERAWATTRQQITEADRLWREVQAEVIHFGSWRQHVEPKIGGVLSSIEEAKARIEEISERIQEALRPAVEAISNVDATMGDFASASNMPLLLAPSGLDAARADAGEPPKLTAIDGQNGDESEEQEAPAAEEPPAENPGDDAFKSYEAKDDTGHVQSLGG
jgi:chromosome segregation ATPase